jgi:hypothetical protein
LEKRRKINMQEQARNIFIIKSALTTKLPLELAYRDPGAPAPTDVEPQTPADREVQSLGDQNRELSASG